ncbi:hypothetical protein [Xanthovirga aplysinae]|uniref:hypothetical protein n=1 Tax=Xanthovirga aplysinae TaxID=2529853 RepID=UPI0012BD0787|nr:hypothetical protein [Xanthovirga aplysinae]MTI29963.1 hypothetical protein [Xanthovirga aplysinae]
MGFSYHNNDVSILNRGLGISGHLQRTGSAVTPGQDPNNNLGAPVFEINASSNLRFVVGRHGSSGPATYFNQLCPASKNTFGHTAGDLNFAVRGDLYLTLAIDVTDDMVEIVIPDICLAQGHSGTSNNWWFGAVNGEYLGNNEVRCKGTITDDDNNIVEATFLRGGNPVNQVNITTARKIPLS